MSFGRQTIKVSLTFPPPDAMNQERINYRPSLVLMSQQFKLLFMLVLLVVACCCGLLCVVLLSDVLLCCCPVFFLQRFNGVLKLAILHDNSPKKILGAIELVETKQFFHFFCLNFELQTARSSSRTNN